MTDNLVPFDELPDGWQAFLVECFGEAIGQGGGLFLVRRLGPSVELMGEKYTEPTAATHTLHVRADGSYCYHGKDFKFWG